MKPKLSISNVNAISELLSTNCPYCHELLGTISITGWSRARPADRRCVAQKFKFVPPRRPGPVTAGGGIRVRVAFASHGACGPAAPPACHLSVLVHALSLASVPKLCLLQGSLGTLESQVPQGSIYPTGTRFHIPDSSLVSGNPGDKASTHAKPLESFT